ncbi:unnamed protein product [marine sediment metagenome]|uniref:HK97 gp10 family phage protein n=1 Tax=marine sediment metagenome TaxID=412755 RepID=X1H5G9_9ZZZZ
MSIKVQIKGLKELQVAFRKSPMLVGKEIQKAIATAVMIIHRNAKMETPTKSGTLRRGIKSRIAPFRGMIESTVAYGVYVHEGTSAHLIRAVNKRALYWKGARHPVKSVQHPGTKANPFMKRGAEKSEGQVQAIFQKAVNNITRKLAVR